MEIKRNYLNHDTIPKDAIMDILNRFERRAFQDIDLDKRIDADDYDSIGRYIMVKKIKKAIGMAFCKDWPRTKYSLDDILKPGKIWD